MFGSQLQYQISSLKAANDSVDGFINVIARVRDEALSMDEGGVAALIAPALLMNGFPDNRISGLTNAVAASMLDRFVASLNKHRDTKNYIFAGVDSQDVLHVILFDLVTGESRAFTSRIQFDGDGFTASLIRDISIVKSLNGLAIEQNAVICWRATAYFCDIEYINETMEG